MKSADFVNLKPGDVVRIKKYPVGDINEKGHVNGSPKNGKVWIANLNMQFCGTVSDYFTARQIELV